MKICLVGSSGGHLAHLYMLKPFWSKHERFWVTFDKEDARSLLKDERMLTCYHPTNRSLKGLIINTGVAWKVLRKEKPDLIISSGAAAAVPFFYLLKMSVKYPAGIFFVQHKETILANFGQLGSCVLALILLAIAVASLLSRMTRLSGQVRRTIVIEVGMQNAAQAIAIASSPFIFDNPVIATPAIIYALLMNIVLLTYVGVIKMRKKAATGVAA